MKTLGISLLVVGLLSVVGILWYDVWAEVTVELGAAASVTGVVLFAVGSVLLVIDADL